jgi:hypothetical protein
METPAVNTLRGHLTLIAQDRRGRADHDVRRHLRGLFTSIDPTGGDAGGVNVVGRIYST